MPNVDESPGAPLSISPVTEIFDGIAVTQEFRAVETKITSIQLELATYARKNRGSLTVAVDRRVSGAWQELARITVEKSEIVDNAYHAFNFQPPLGVKVGQRIALTLTADGERSDAITWWSSPEWQLPEHRLFVNGKPESGTAHFRVTYDPLIGIAAGPRMRQRLWKRITIFLDVPGQIALGSGFLMALFAFVHLLLWPTGDEPSPGPSSLGTLRARARAFLRRRARLGLGAPEGSRSNPNDKE
jgi:hypothetical protein